MKILLAVSGGIDSMYMLERASELFPGASFAVAHCNFSLRGEESDGDEAFVRARCVALGVDFHVRRFDTRAEAESKGISIEMAARDLRYAWFSDLCRELGCDALAVAHNANDNAETLLLNMLRGTGSRGLRGMSADSLRSDGLRILRPLLGITRQEIHGWMADSGLGWREDHTNAETEYKRNKIRNLVFPVFEEINPSFVRTLNADMNHFAQLDDIAEEYFRESASSVLSGGEISISGLLSLKHWEYVLWRIMEPYGMGGDVFGSLTGLLKSGRQISGKSFHTASGMVALASDRIILPSGEEPRIPELKLEWLDRAEIKELRQPAGVLIADADRIPQPLKVRGWKEGDWMVPFGMKGRKKLSDLFCDLGWSVEEKKKAVVVELDGSHVAVLAGVRIDDSVKVSSETSKVLRIKL